MSVDHDPALLQRARGEPFAAHGAETDGASTQSGDLRQRRAGTPSASTGETRTEPMRQVDDQPTEPFNADPALSATGGSASGHLYQIDLFRLLTFACVILVHTLTMSTSPESGPSYALQMLLHFTREAFFALTGFVLTRRALQRSQPARRFWRRRFPLVATPYVMWTVVYWLVQTWPAREDITFGDGVNGLLQALVEGSGWYHLYFLLVTLQVYLVFPPLLALLRATRGYHKWVLAVSLALQVLVAWLVVVPPFTSPSVAELWGHVDATLLAYQFYTVLGMVAAMHFTAVHRWVREHGRLIGVLLLSAIAVAQVGYWYSVLHGTSVHSASEVFLPPMIVYFVLVVIALYAASAWWGARRQEDDVATRVVRYASDRSFGIFLAHPLLIALLVPLTGPVGETIGVVPAVALLYLAVVAGSVALADVLRRLPGSRALTGRDRLAAPLRRAPGGA